MSMSIIESKLIDLGRWAIQSTQILGYLPIRICLTKSNRSQFLKTLTFKVKSYPVLLTSVSLLFSVLWVINYFYKITPYSKFIKISGPTERYAHSCLLIVSFLVGVIFRVQSLSEGYKIVEFWQDNCTTLERIQVALGCDQTCILDKEEFRSIRGALKRSVLLILVASGLHILMYHGGRFLASVLDETPWGLDSELYVAAGFWSLLILVHGINTLWVSFFVRVYTAGFTCIANRIKMAVGCHREFVGLIYVSELFHLPTSQTKLTTVQKNNARDSHVLDEMQLNYCIDAFTLLEKQVERFNGFFGDKIIVEMVLCITNLVVNAFFATLWIGRGAFIQMLKTIVPFGIFANILFGLGTTAGEMTLAARAVASALFEKVPLGQLSPSTCLKVQMLVSKIGTGPPVISAKHFFVINRHLVTSVLSAMTTFLVVLVQFRDSDSTDMLLSRSKPIAKV